MSLLVSNLLLCSLVLNLATSALLVRSGRRNSGEFGIYCPPLVLVCLVSEQPLSTRNKLQRKPPTVLLCGLFRRSLKIMGAFW